MPVHQPDESSSNPERVFPPAPVSVSIELIPCTDFPAPFHPLACTFVTDEAFRSARFPTTARFWQAPLAELLQLGQAKIQRAALVQALQESMEGLICSPQQARYLQELGSPQGVAVVTGQQVGFLGGPFYTALKAMAIVALAQRLGAFLNRPVVPLFWIEDNDSDGAEAGSIAWWQREGPAELLVAAPTAELQQPLTVAARSLLPGGQWEAAVERILSEAPPEIASLLRSAYRPGVSWSYAFLLLLQWLVGDAGVLFLRSSVARRCGLFIPILEWALSNAEQLHKALHEAESWLHRRGHTVQIPSAMLPIHFHTPEGYRYRIRQLPTGGYAIAQQRYSTAGLRELFAQHPTAFSPAALLRPVCQQYAIPTIAVVLGPAEIAYWAQLRELYELLELPMPMVTLRPSLTLVPPAIHRLLTRHGWNALQFLAPWHQLETTLLRSLPSVAAAEHRIAELRAALRQWYEQQLSDVHAVDPTLVPSLGATHHRIEQALQRWERRLRAAFRRRAELFLHHAQQVWWLLFPQGQPQERRLSWLQLSMLCGLESFRAALQQSTTLPPGVHAVLTVPGEAVASAPEPTARIAESPPR